MKNSKLKTILLSSRPIKWLIPVAVFLIAFVKVKASFSENTVSLIIQLAMMMFPLNLFIYGINDIYDYETDKKNKRKGGIEGGVLDKKYHKLVLGASFLGAAAFLLSSVLTLNPTNIMASIILLIVGYFYSAPPIRLKEIPILDSLSNASMFFLVYVIGWSYGGSIQEIPLKAYLVALSVTGIHAFTTIVDYKPDKNAGVKTVSTILGKRFAGLFSATCFLITVLFADVDTLAVNIYIAYLALCGIIIAVWPREKIASFLSKTMFVGFFVAAIIYVIVKLS